MKGDEVRELSDTEFTTLTRKRLTKSQIKELEIWAEEFEALPLNMQICLAHYMVHDFLGIPDENGDPVDADGDPLELPNKFNGGMFG